MLKWIKMLNKMYENHSHTCDGRVVVSYCDEMRIVIVKTYDKYHIINADDYNDLGLLNEINKVVFDEC